jgi:hypothetical protein
VRLIRQVCQLSGRTNLIAETRASLRAEGVASAVRRHDSAALFDWLITMLSYRGIANRVAADYLERHGQATWQAIESDLHRRPSCPKLKSYWHFYDCRTARNTIAAPSPSTSRSARCPSIGCATAGSIRRPFPCICSFATSPAGTSWAGSIGGYRPPRVPDPAGWPPDGRRSSPR